MMPTNVIDITKQIKNHISKIYALSPCLFFGQSFDITLYFEIALDILFKPIVNEVLKIIPANVIDIAYRFKIVLVRSAHQSPCLCFCQI